MVEINNTFPPIIKADNDADIYFCIKQVLWNFLTHPPPSPPPPFFIFISK